MGKAAGKIIGTIVFSVVLLLILAVAFTAFLSTNSKNSFAIGNYSVYTVLTTSMLPTFDAGSVIIVEKIPEDELAVTDIITYYPVEDDTTLCTHRIVNIETDENGTRWFTTRGDANNVDDSPIVYSGIVGKAVFWANGVGSVLQKLRSPVGIVSIIVVTGLFIVLSSVLEKRKKRRLSEAELMEDIEEEESMEEYEEAEEDASPVIQMSSAHEAMARLSSVRQVKQQAAPPVELYYNQAANGGPPPGEVWRPTTQPDKPANAAREHKCPWHDTCVCNPYAKNPFQMPGGMPAQANPPRQQTYRPPEPVRAYQNPVPTEPPWPAKVIPRPPAHFSLMNEYAER